MTWPGSGFHQDALEQVRETYPTSLAEFLGQVDTFRHADTTMRNLTEDEFLRGKERLRRAVRHAEDAANRKPEATGGQVIATAALTESVSDLGDEIAEDVFLPVGCVRLPAACERAGQRAADGGKAGVFDGLAGWARAELRADRRREVGIHQRVGHVCDGERGEARRSGKLLSWPCSLQATARGAAGGAGGISGPSSESTSLRSRTAPADPIPGS